MGDLKNDNSFVLQKEINIEERPVSGYSYIYIYSCNNIYIYVGQTIQSIMARYRNHLSDNSGAHYANQIHCIQISSKYANYAEGYLAYRVKGISQGNIPNYEYYKDDTPKKVRSFLQKVGNKLTNYKSTEKYLQAGNYPIFSFEISGDGNCKVLDFFRKIVEEHTILWNNFIPSMTNYSSYLSDIYLKELVFDERIPVYMITAPQTEQRPICFFVANSASDIKMISNIRSNLPVYCVLKGIYFEKYKKHIDSIFSKSGVGILLDHCDKVSNYKSFHKLYGSLNMNCADLTRFFGKTKYRAYNTHYGYFRCA